MRDLYGCLLICKFCNKPSNKYIKTHYGIFCSEAHFKKFWFLKLESLSVKYKVSLDVVKKLEEEFIKDIDTIK